MINEFENGEIINSECYCRLLNQLNEKNRQKRSASANQSVLKMAELNIHSIIQIWLLVTTISSETRNNSFVASFFHRMWNLFQS